MGNRDHHAPRLFADEALGPGARVTCADAQANYLLNVMRLREGDEVLLFNGRNGEWLARLADVSKRRCALECAAQVREQAAGPDIHYVFAPLKHARLDYMVQKATEMGVAKLCPVLTRHTNAARVNTARMHANAIEAAEQCRILWVPDVAAPVKLEALLSDWNPERRIIFCDEAADVSSPLEVLSTIAPGPLAVLVGPEGGFEAGERELLLAKPFAIPISLGPRVMRADTAAVAALALANAVLGDWS